MGDLAAILYERFFLRDLLGKIAPGYFATVAVLHALSAAPSEAVLGADQSYLFWISALPAVYITGVALQILGELLGLHSASPKPRYVFFFKAKRSWAAANTDFDQRLAAIRKLPVERWKEQRERFIVLKEASGNAAVALLIVAAALVLSEGEVPYASLIVLGVLWLLLVFSHFLHAQRQARFEINTLRDAQELTQACAAEMEARIEWHFGMIGAISVIALVLVPALLSLPVA